MRITNPMVTRNYTKSLHNNRGLLDRYSNQVMDGRKFYSMSEDTASGVRAMQVRRNLSRLEAYLDNASAAQSFLSSAESLLMKVSDLSHSTSEKFVSAINGDKGPQERDIIATEIEKLRDELLSVANSQYAGRNMFGGTNTATQPFQVGDDGALLYNGVDVKLINQSHALMKDAAYIDLGVGLRFNDDLDGQKVDPSTAFKNTLVGVEFLGCGDENLYLMMTEMIDALRDPNFDPDGAGKILDRFNESAAAVNVQITKLGADSQYLEFTVDRLKTEKLNLQVRQESIEALDPEEAIMNFKVQEYVYTAALQMGQRLLQPTLFNFIN